MNNTPLNPLFTTKYLNEVGNNLQMLLHIQDMGRDLNAPSEFMSEVQARIGVLSVPEQATKTTGTHGNGAACSRTTETALPPPPPVAEQVTKTDAQVTQMKDEWRKIQSENKNLQREIEKLKSDKEKLQQQCTYIFEFYEKKIEQMSAGASGQCLP